MNLRQRSLRGLLAASLVVLAGCGINNIPTYDEVAIRGCGHILSTELPTSPDNHNELDNRLILIGYD